MPTKEPTWPPGGAGSALVRLKDMTWWTKPREATRYLANQMEGARLLNLYRHYFPKEYTASRASLKVRPSMSLAIFTHIKSNELHAKTFA